MATGVNDDIGTHSGPTLSFPSIFNNGGANFILYGAGDKLRNKHKAVRNSDNATAAKYSDHLKRIKTRNLDLKHVRSQYFTEDATNITRYRAYMPTISLGDPNIGRNGGNTYYEDPFHLPSDMLREINWYRFVYTNPTHEIISTATETGETKYSYLSSKSSPSLFNPKFNVQSIGMTYNVPLLLDKETQAVDNDVSDCSITKLIELSQTNQLGQQKYRLVDFIFGADYGKVSNNHMITLRRFALPVGDIIGEAAGAQYETNDPSQVGVNNSDDIAHLVTWFGTEDNKLEDIVKYSYEYSWKQLEAKRQDIDSKEGDQERGLIGLFANMTPQYSQAVNAGYAPPGRSLLGKFTSHLDGGMVTSEDAKAQLRMYDNNAVYTPLQTVQDTHIPEGKLKFSNEFTLTFRYKLRAYENINPKSAFLDLLANIHECTYFRGKFWGGSQNIIGPGPNNAQYIKAYKFLDNAFDKLGGVMKAVASGGVNLESFMGILSTAGGAIMSSVKNLVNGGIEGIKNALSGASEKAKETAIDITENFGPMFLDVMKGQLKNALGRPSFYAFDSLLTDKIVGLWHVTIGNPRNPIVSMGNLILTKAEVQHSGPLGLDDFPTEIKVICTLKHAMSRDLTNIQKMYTQGIAALYQTKQRNKMVDQLLGEDMNETAKSLDDLSSKEDSKRFEDRQKLDTQLIQSIQKQSPAYDPTNAKGISKQGRIRDTNTARIAQLGTSNILKLQIALDQIAPTVG